MDPSPSNVLLQLSLQRLKIPPLFADTSENDGPIVPPAEIEGWISQAVIALRDLHEYLLGTSSLSQEDNARIIIACVPFRERKPWAPDEAVSLANSTYGVACILQFPLMSSLDVLSRYTTPSTTLIKIVLSKHIKPAFQANLHPSLNVQTGRKLPRQVGGILSQQDYLENQHWKMELGLIDVLQWCICHVEAC